MPRTKPRSQAPAAPAAAPASDQAPAGRRLLEVSIDLVDEPELAARQTVDETKLAELAESISLVGILEPLVVEARGSRYRIMAGHRRYLAARIARIETVPVVVQAAAAVDAEAVKTHENKYREDLNPVEEAHYFARLLESRCNGDVDQLAALVKERRAYVEGRLLLLQGDEQVLEALRLRRISLAVARELNKFADQGYRRMFLDSAIKGGATQPIVAQWRADHERAFAVGYSDAAYDPNAGAPPVERPTTSMVCILCDRAEEFHDMELIYVHRGCKRITLDRFLRSLKGE